MGAVSTWPLLHHTTPTGFFTFVESFFFENKKYLCGYHRRRTELSKHNFVVLFFLISSYRRKQHKKFIVYLPSFPQCNHLGPRVLANGGGSISVFHFTLQSVYQFRMSFLHSKTSWACQKWMTRKNRWGYLWTSSQIVVRWRYTLTFFRPEIAYTGSLKLEGFVNHSPAARDLQILLVFYQHPAWFISL